MALGYFGGGCLEGEGDEWNVVAPVAAVDTAWKQSRYAFGNGIHSPAQGVAASFVRPVDFSVSLIVSQ